MGEAARRKNEPYDPFSPRGCVGQCHAPSGLQPYKITKPLDDPVREAEARVSGVPVSVLRVMVQRLYEEDARATVRAQLTRH